VILDALRREGVDDATAVIVSSDHGETLGELGIYCDHQTADEHVAHVPAVIRWPGLEPGVDGALHYQIDLAASVLELLDLEVPPEWDGRSFEPGLRRRGTPTGRDFLVLTQGAWTAQRAVRFENWICIHTYDDGYHGFPPVLLFDLAADPHEQDDQSVRRPEVTAHAGSLMRAWLDDVLSGTTPLDDPLETVMVEGGPWHAQQGDTDYLERLRATGRGEWASAFAARGRVTTPTPATRAPARS
jgi:arylsulfatase A-like enzyme